LYSTDGSKYKTIGEMWDNELKSDADGWYDKSQEYWRGQTASIDGMLGGLGNLDGKDVAASNKFIGKLFKDGIPDGSVALDCGAGIGRVTKHLLLPLFSTVDILEQNTDYIETSRNFLRDAHPKHKVEHRLCVGMQDFSPEKARQDMDISVDGRYDLIWIQWSIIYLGDDDFISFLRHCVKCIRPGGFVCIKENVARSGFLVDNEDSSISRSDNYMKSLFQRADLKLVQEARQTDFPSSLFPVKMYALQPINVNIDSGATDEQ